MSGKQWLAVGFFSVLSFGLVVGWRLLPSAAAPSAEAPAASPVSVVDGRQIIDITARGGYSPKYVEAQAGLPTLIRVSTKGTYDCSAAVAIPDLKFETVLKPNDVAEIEVPAERAKGIIQGTCSMGMYGFRIRFL